MSRELNPELFGEKRVSIEGPVIVGDRVPEPDFLDVDRQILDLRNQNQKLQTQMAELVKNSNLKIEKLQQQLARLETSHNGLAHEIGTRLTQMQARIIERASYDAKTQEMIDRHNQVIKSFEVRMGQLQRILQEKEAQLNSSMQALNEAKTEISRLKRI